MQSVRGNYTNVSYMLPYSCIAEYSLCAMALSSVLGYTLTKKCLCSQDTHTGYSSLMYLAVGGNILYFQILYLIDTSKVKCLWVLET